MAAQAEVLVEVPDVLGHAARAAGRRTARRGRSSPRPSPLRPCDGLVAAAAGRCAARVAVVPAGAVAPDPAARPRRARRGRTCAAGGRTSPSWPHVPWKAPWCVRRAARGSPHGGRPASGPGTSSSRCRSPRAAWASLLPTSGRPCSVGEPDDRARGRYRPSAVGLNVSIASGRTAGSSSASSRRSTEPWAHSGYGTSGWAGMARPPWSWIASIDQRRLAQRPAPAARGTGRAGGRRGS